MALLIGPYAARAAVLVLVMSAVAGTVRVAAQLAEEDVKAAFIYNFAKFTQWPDGKGGQLVIGVIGRDPVYPALVTLARGKPVAGREVAVREIARDEDLRAYHIIYIPASEDRRVADVLGAVSRAPVLTVGESPTFLRDGGIVQLFIQENRVRFRINAEAATRSGLRISSQLLNLAREQAHP